MVPGGTVVAGPRGGVTLGARVPGTRHYERTLIGPKRKLAFISAARVLHSINVMYFQMSRGPLLESGLVDTMLNIVRHGFARCLEHRRLFHIIPESRHTLTHKRFIEPTPPLPR